ncbi:2-oxo acid dehydrogenase subunit E2 [uncultured Sphaerochaeta sp.]|uniref:2-oxo acid dehydrogenase subunit E2 n=1 Tax=uncultured Sphaerochaeta sp. TaxID=886478 RepID=UPI002A0A93E7|nr:2-oxo acid dehydrogenase subunit E2 [uncultured Sphaerochaeta sp.]
MNKRNDAVRVFDILPYKQVFPFVMRKRSEALVFQTMILDLTKAVEFIKNNKAPDGRNYRVFELFIAAIMRTIVLRPELNRFLANNKYWQRNDLSVNFVVKEDYTDDAPEHSMPLYFKEDMILPEFSEIINQAIIDQRKPSNSSSTDDLIRFFLHFPQWFIKLCVAFLRVLDNHGKAPKGLLEADGLHTTIFISNMGSIGLGGGSPHHHLYEWGTTSLFATMGIMRRTRKKVEDKTIFTDLMEVGFTVDERITDGFYFTKSINLMQDLLNNPASLMERPVLPPKPLTKKEFKKKLKAQKRDQKAVISA